MDEVFLKLCAQEPELNLDLLRFQRKWNVDGRDMLKRGIRDGGFHPCFFHTHSEGRKCHLGPPDAPWSMRDMLRLTVSQIEDMRTEERLKEIREAKDWDFVEPDVG